MKRILMYSLVFTAVLLSSCDRDEKPASQFVFGGNKINLKGAKLYLAAQGNSNVSEHIYRNYFISDGEYTNGSGDYGWSLDDYDGATFFFGIQLAVPNDEEFEKGKFPLFEDWGLVIDDQNFCTIFLGSGKGDAQIGYYNRDENEEDSPVVVSGGFEDGDSMTLKFSGKLTFFHKDPNSANWIEETVSGKFYFTGTVQDKR